MKQSRFSLLLTVLALAALSSCTQRVPRFSEKAPFALEVKRVRSYFQAQAIEARLHDMDIPAYMVSLKDEENENNEWYIVLTGAEADTVSIVQLKAKIEIETDLEDLAVVNYQKVLPFLTEVEAKQITEVAKIQAERPDLPEGVFELLEKFPENNLFKIKNISLHHFPDANIPRRHLSSFYETTLDLPRGVGRSLVAKNSSAFAEVIYEDNLFADQVTIDILQLREDHELQALPRAQLTRQDEEEILGELTPDDLAWYFAALILNTGNYLTETYEKIQVASFVDLVGYKVVIEPRSNYLRTYMVLVDQKGEFVLFSQSTDKTDEEILTYLEDFGKSQGLLAYNEFHNTFFTIPKCLDEDDVFLGYSTDILDYSYYRSKGYAKWAKAMIGHLSASAHFYHTESGKSWTCSSFDLLTEKKKDYIYGDMYSNTDTRGKTKLKVLNQDGYFVQNGYYNYQEVNFATPGRHVMAVGGNGFSREDLLERATLFQSGTGDASFDPCAEQEL